VVWKLITGRNSWNESNENILWLEERRNYLRIIIGGIGSVCIKHSFSIVKEFFNERQIILISIKADFELLNLPSCKMKFAGRRNPKISDMISGFGREVS